MRHASGAAVLIPVPVPELVRFVAAAPDRRCPPTGACTSRCLAREHILHLRALGTANLAASPRPSSLPLALLRPRVFCVHSRQGYWYRYHVQFCLQPRLPSMLLSNANTTNCDNNVAQRKPVRTTNSLAAGPMRTSWQQWSGGWEWGKINNGTIGVTDYLQATLPLPSLTAWCCCTADSAVETVCTPTDSFGGRRERERDVSACVQALPLFVSQLPGN